MSDQAAWLHPTGYNVPYDEIRVTPQASYKMDMARAILCFLTACCAVNLATGQDVDFNRDIRPLLSNNCFQCHGPDAETREAELRLDVEDEAKAYAIIPGDLDSELLRRITSTDADEVMPPPDSGKQLSEKQVAMLQSWIQEGAKWSPHWAYVPPRRSEIPAVSSRVETRNWIDHFIAARVEQAALEMSPEADSVTLARRLYFDLTGLPPTSDDVHALASDDGPHAYESLVDRLLDSPHFGERMAIYWLDLVRYADTVGYHGDQDQNISPYRDYVIDAFNRDLPFDQFTREQLAGDLIQDHTIDQLIATGYNRMLQTSHEGGVQPREYLSIYQADRVRNLSAVWMGGTLGCAQCHDHKYDPYTAADFYSMAAFFADIDEEQHFKKGTNSLPTARPPEIDVLGRPQRERLEELDREIARIQARDATADQTPRLEELEAERKWLNKQHRRTMITAALKQPRTVRLLPRGNWLDESGPVMQPAVPTFLGRIADGDGTRPSRLDLANWLVDPERGHGLFTARVMVNRVWYLMFGQGLCESLDDFGAQGKPPVHPELLDNLAIEFVEGGWSVKSIIKLMVMSRTYRQSSAGNPSSRERDPQNRLFARQSRYRLPAEMIRDTALSVSGLLVDEYGGASVKPYQPLGYYRHLNFPQRRYAHHGDERQWRRGVYVHWQRQYLHPMLKAFDAPSREECTARRPRSNTPLAALVLLNDPTFIEAARGLAQRLLVHGHSDIQRMDDAFEIVVSRKPSDVERTALLKLLAASRAQFVNTDRAESFLAIGERQHESHEPAELAAWTAVSRAILNLSEATTRR